MAKRQGTVDKWDMAIGLFQSEYIRFTGRGHVEPVPEKRVDDAALQNVIVAACEFVTADSQAAPCPILLLTPPELADCVALLNANLLYVYKDSGSTRWWIRSRKQSKTAVLLLALRVAWLNWWPQTGEEPPEPPTIDDITELVNTWWTRGGIIPE